MPGILSVYIVLLDISLIDFTLKFEAPAVCCGALVPGPGHLLGYKRELAPWGSGPRPSHARTGKAGCMRADVYCGWAITL